MEARNCLPKSVFHCSKALIGHLLFTPKFILLMGSGMWVRGIGLAWHAPGSKSLAPHFIYLKGRCLTC